MDYSRPELADRLAAEYALGTLRGPARRRFETLMPAHPRLRQATHDWERRLSQLDTEVQPVAPSPTVWSHIEGRLWPADASPARDLPGPVAQAVRWWQRLGLWQGLSGLASAAVLVLAVKLSAPVPVQPPIVVVMSANSDAPSGAVVQPVAYVASVSGDGRSLVVRPIQAGRMIPVDKALELWAVPPQGAPRSLGLLSQDGPTTVLRTELLKDTAAFAITVEPPGGAPGGKATGPIVSVGKLQI